MKTRNITGYLEAPIPRSKAKLIKWLKLHSRYRGSYSVGIRFLDNAMAVYEQEEVSKTALGDAEIEKVEYVNASAVLSERIKEILSELDAPFSWGENDISLVTASSIANFFVDHIHNEEEDKEEMQAHIDKLNALGDLYVDLEN
jgi:hypothetical protein